MPGEAQSSQMRQQYGLMGLPGVYNSMRRGRYGRRLLGVKIDERADVTRVHRSAKGPLFDLG